MIKPVSFGLFNDWTTVLVQVEHEKLDTGYFMSTLPGGEIQFQSDKNLSLMGSWESRIQVKSIYSSAYYNNSGKATHLLVHGNLTKFMQGHAVVGSPDFQSVVIGAVRFILNQLKIVPNDLEVNKINKGEMELTRVDITQMTRLSNNNDVESYLRKYAASATYRGKRVLIVGNTNRIWGTNYIQKCSSWWTFKNYNKFHDLTLAHRLPDYLPMKKQLLEYSEGMVRHELTLRKPQLRKFEITTLKDLTNHLIKSHYQNHREKITVADNLKLTDDIIAELPRHLLATYLIWQNGLTVTQHFNNRMTFLRHRKALLKFDIDINTLVERNTNVIPMVRILEPKIESFESLPAWFNDNNLIYHGLKHG